MYKQLGSSAWLAKEPGNTGQYFSGEAVISLVFCEGIVLQFVCACQVGSSKALAFSLALTEVAGSC